MFGFQEEIDLFGIEMDVENFFYHSRELPVSVVKQIAEKYQVSKSIVQMVMHEFQEEIRKMEWCLNKNHNDGKWVVDDSYGGPESGYMGFHCKKCGYSVGQRLY